MPRQRYAAIAWCAEDVQQFRPNWSVKRCNQFLDDNEDYIQVSMIEAGNDAIKECLLAGDKEDD
jgi:hypothetical protein